MGTFARPITIGRLHELLSEGTECEVVATHAESAKIRLESLTAMGKHKEVDFSIEPSPNEGWAIFKPIKPN